MKTCNFEWGNIKKKTCSSISLFLHVPQLLASTINLQWHLFAGMESLSSTVPLQFGLSDPGKVLRWAESAGRGQSCTQTVVRKVGGADFRAVPLILGARAGELRSTCQWTHFVVISRVWAGCPWASLSHYNILQGFSVANPASTQRHHCWNQRVAVISLGICWHDILHVWKLTPWTSFNHL